MTQHMIMTQEEFLNQMSSNQLITRITEITVELLEITQQQGAIIKQQNFNNTSTSQDYIKNLVTEMSNLQLILAKRANIKSEVGQNKLSKLDGLHKKLGGVLESNRANLNKIIALNKIAMDAISDAIAYHKKFERGYDKNGDLPKAVVIRNNIDPLNLNEQC